MIVRCSAQLETVLVGFRAPAGYKLVDIFRDSRDFRCSTVTLVFSDHPEHEADVREADLQLSRGADDVFTAVFMNLRQRNGR